MIAIVTRITGRHVATAMWCVRHPDATDNERDTAAAFARRVHLTADERLRLDEIVARLIYGPAR